MKHTILVMRLFLVAGVAVGCASGDGESAAESKQPGTAAVQRDKATTATKEAAQAIQDYAYAQRAEFIDEMKEELSQIQVELDKLSAEIDRSSGVAKDDAKADLEALREKWTDAKKQLDQAESATESSWEDAQGRFKKSHNDLKDSLDKTRQWLSEKIAP